MVVVCFGGYGREYGIERDRLVLPIPIILHLAHTHRTTTTTTTALPHHTIKSPTSPSPPHAPASHQTPPFPIRKSPRRVPQPARCQLSFHPTSEKGPSPNIHQPNPNQTKPNQIANDETLPQLFPFLVACDN